MKFLSNILSVLLGITLLGALAAGAYFGLKYVAGLFGRIDQQAAIVTAIAAVTVLLSASMIAGSLRWAKTREQDQQLRAQKAALYERFLKTWSETLPAGAGEMKFSEDLRALEKPLLLWASPEVLKAYLTLQEQEKSFSPQSDELSSSHLELILAMRHDLGQSIQGLDKAGLLNLLRPSLENVIEAPAPAVNNNHSKLRFPV